MRRAVPILWVGLALASCGGGNGGGNGSTTPPPPGGGPENPCTSASLETDARDAPPDPLAARRKATALDRDPRWRVLDALWTHRQLASRRDTAAERARDSVDVGELAVLQDAGDLIGAANAFDLRNTGLRFTRNGAGGYDVGRIDGAFRAALGTALALSDDDSRRVDVPFAFAFYGGSHTTAFVNSDGNVTFEEEDRASSERNVARLLTGPPRVAPFMADLDPSAGGRVFANAAADQYTVTWCGVRGFESTSTATAQLTLLPDGSIEFKYATVSLADSIVGVSPGRTGEFAAVNLGDGAPGGSGAVGERFAGSAQLDTVEVVRRFYETHEDRFDQLVIWTDARLVRGAFAYETTVANEIRGLGIETYDVSRDFGSGGRLRSFAVMDFIGKYPEDPRQRVLGENSTLAVLAHESGHRWLAFFEFRNHRGERSDALLGRDAAHWSFFFDSDASVMEGNDIEDLGGGSFRTSAAAERYSLLDQYAMGLVPPTQVPPFFYVESPVNVRPDRSAGDAPQVGVTFNGTRRDVLMQDVIAEMGDRVPTAAGSPRVHRQAFIFVVGAGRTADPAHIERIDRIRREWEPFFEAATDGRMRVETGLR